MDSVFQIFFGHEILLRVREHTLESRGIGEEEVMLYYLS